MDKNRVSWVALVWECLGNPFLFVTYNFPPTKKFAHIYFLFYENIEMPHCGIIFKQPPHFLLANKIATLGKQWKH